MEIIKNNCFSDYFLKSIDNISNSKDELLNLFHLLNESSEVELDKINKDIEETISKNKHSTIFFYFIITNRLIKQSNKIMLFKKNNGESEYSLEIILLLNFLKKNLIESICEYINVYEIDFEEDIFVKEILNTILKIPTIITNHIRLNKNLIHSNTRLIYEQIPFELQEDNYYMYIWKSTLNIIAKQFNLKNKSFNFLKNLFKRLFVRGYGDYLCKIIINFISEDNFYQIIGTESDIKFIVQKILFNIMEILKEDNLHYLFVKQLLKEIERSKIKEDQNNIFILSKNEHEVTFLLNLCSLIMEYCIENQDIAEELFIKQIFCIYKQSFSLKICLLLLDVSIIDIEVNKINNLDFFNNFDYIEYSKKKELYVKFKNTKKYSHFYKKLLKKFSNEWKSINSSTNFTLNLSILIIRIVSILIYLNSNKLLDIKDFLFTQHQDITEGIQSRLKNIDPIIRGCSMYLGEFYFNLIFELFPNKNTENNDYLINEIPKFNELDSFNEMIKKQLKHLFNCHKSIIFVCKNDYLCNINSICIYEDKDKLDKKKEKDVGDKNEINSENFDKDDIFWENAPSLKKLDHKNENQCNNHFNSIQNNNSIKTVNKALDLIKYYTDEKKSSDVLDKDKKLLDVLKNLAENIETDTSDYNYLIFPLIDKIITLKMKDQKCAVLVIISKLIQFKTDIVAIEIINYAFDLNSNISMDTRILLLNSLILACQNLSNSRSHYSLHHSKYKLKTNLFDCYSLSWSSILTKNIINIIKQSQNSIYEKIPNIFFITSLELFNQIISNISSNNAYINQISYLVFEFVLFIDVLNPIFQDTIIRRSIYIIMLNIIQKCNQSLQNIDNDLIPQITDWVSKSQYYESDPDCIQIISEINYLHQ